MGAAGPEEAARVMRARVGELMLQADDSGAAGAEAPGVAGGGGGGGALLTAGLAAFAAAAFASCATGRQQFCMLTAAACRARVHAKCSRWHKVHCSW